MPNDRMKLEGFDELVEKLGGDYATAREAAIEAVNEGAKVIEKQAKANAPKESGLLKKAIGVIQKAYNVKRVFAAIVKPRPEKGGTYKGKYRRPMKYGWLSENGHIDAKTKRFVPGSLWLRRAVTQRGAAAQARMAAVFKEKLAAKK